MFKETGYIDTYDAAINPRPYKNASSHKEALEEIERCSGTQFDPEIAKVFVNIMKVEWLLE